ncbi:hypothetical protein MKK75_15780 [Methylobacterium sp. J-030]|uniref:hypothetical protein n=1 Tax=Methylobacterium sp. J-030 TaxID=2836627 RepID=UPI001FBC010B|nr:hypothetical protein [Methylobacterium sp. J-030]MCJ2070242.1 hypothetical protein [Methylobacterium sp. J-030]
MRRILISILLLVAAGQARAEDFTGFYAGLNAGYARGHEHDRTTREPHSLGVEPGADLPPSARDAALALRRSAAVHTESPSGR